MPLAREGKERLIATGAFVGKATRESTRANVDAPWRGTGQDSAVEKPSYPKRRNPWSART